MAIQLRRGAYNDLNINALLPGEAAVVLSGDPNTDSGKALYICFSTGEVQRFIASEEAEAKLTDIPVMWSGSSLGASNYNVEIGETYVGIKEGDFYKVHYTTPSGSKDFLYYVTEVFSEASTPYFTVKPLFDEYYIGNNNPPNTSQNLLYDTGFVWVNAGTGRVWMCKNWNYTQGSTPFTYMWLELTDSSWEQLATVDVEDLSDTPDGFIWDVDSYDDLKIIINGVTSVTGNRNIDIRLTTSGGASEHIGMFANLINQTSKDIKLKATRNTGTATMELTGSIMRSAYPYVDDASFNRDVAVPSGAITKVELIISGGGGLATGEITLLGRKRG